MFIRNQELPEHDEFSFEIVNYALTELQRIEENRYFLESWKDFVKLYVYGA